MPCRSGWGAKFATFAALCASAAFPLHAQDAAPAADPAAADAAVPDDTLGLSDARRRLSVEVRIADNGPYDFVVDTGAERTVISKELAQRLALKAGDKVTLHSMSGSRVVDTAVIPSLLVSRNPVTDIHAPALAEAHLGAAGMLGTDTLQDQRVLFDFDKKEMTISRSVRQQRRTLGTDAIVVTARSLYGRLIVADARVEGEKVVVVIDTGSDVTIGNGALKARLTRKQKLGQGYPISLLTVLGQSITADYTAMKRITIGGVALENMPIAFSDVQLFKQLNLDKRPAILLGMDTMQLFDRVSIDFANKKVEFLSDELAGIPQTRFAAR